MHYIILALIGLVIAFFAIWILGVWFFRIFGFLVALSVLATGITLLIGIVYGIVLPATVLRSKELNKLAEIATPARVKSGSIITTPPHGAAKNFGWDPAWPNYVPYQLRFDTAEVWESAKAAIAVVWELVNRWSPSTGGCVATVLLSTAKILTVVLPAVGLSVGIAAGVTLWLIIAKVFQYIVLLTQWLTTMALRQRENRFMKRTTANVRCVHCYRETGMPTYQCPNPSCGRKHHDVSPGPLGIKTRICECESTLPLTVAAASKVLTAECPHCERELPQGSGSRRVVVVPIFGSVGAGKTQFLSTTASSLHILSEKKQRVNAFTPLSQAAHQFLSTSLEELKSGRAPMKTQHSERPEGYPYLVETANDPFELHLMDAAGENFGHADDSRSLSYLDISNSLVFLHDPLTIPEVREHLSLTSFKNEIQVAQRQGNDAYGSVVDRLRDAGENLSQKKLAVVITKSDILSKLYPDAPIPSESAGVRDWLYEHGSDNLVRRIEIDFDNVEYFAVDSSAQNNSVDQLHPLRVVDWVLSNTGGTSLYEESEHSPVPGKSPNQPVTDAQEEPEKEQSNA